MYREFDAAELMQGVDQLVELDANHVRPDLAAAGARMRYFAVGTPSGVK